MMSCACFRDEAARIWQQRESEWARERLARERLMDEVLIILILLCRETFLELTAHYKHVLNSYSPQPLTIEFVISSLFPVAISKFENSCRALHSGHGRKKSTDPKTNGGCKTGATRISGTERGIGA